MPRFQKEAKRFKKRSIRAGEFDIIIHDLYSNGKAKVSTVHRATGEETLPKGLYSENIDYMERELKRGVIHQDLCEFNEPFLEEWEQAVDKTNEFRKLRGLSETEAKVIRVNEEKEKIVRKKLPKYSEEHTG